MIKTVDNFDSSFVNRVEKSTGFEFINPGNSLYFVESTRAENDLYIDLKSYNNQSNDLLSIFKLQSISKQPADIDDLIISIQNSNNDYTVKTGNYVGLFSWGNNLEINIGSRFGNVFLTRMLNLPMIFFWMMSMLQVIWIKNQNWTYHDLLSFTCLFNAWKKRFYWVCRRLTSLSDIMKLC